MISKLFNKKSVIIFFSLIISMIQIVKCRLFNLNANAYI